MSRKLLLGFTLTEVMIAVAIVGIVAAFTVPVVISNYNKQTMQALLQKNYIELGQNLTTFQSENIYRKSIFASSLCMKQFSDRNVDNTAGTFLKNYYTVKQDCGSETAQPCFADSYRSLEDPTLKEFNCSGYSVKVAGGAAICIYPATLSYRSLFGPNGMIREEMKNPARVTIDVNGAEEPNIGGRDIFTFNIYEDYSIAEFSPLLEDEEKETMQKEVEAGCTSSEIGVGCLTKLMSANWKMNY